MTEQSQNHSPSNSTSQRLQPCNLRWSPELATPSVVVVGLRRAERTKEATQLAPLLVVVCSAHFDHFVTAPLFLWRHCSFFTCIALLFLILIILGPCLLPPVHACKSCSVLFAIDDRFIERATKLLYLFSKLVPFNESSENTISGAKTTLPLWPIIEKVHFFDTLKKTSLMMALWSYESYSETWKGVWFLCIYDCHWLAFDSLLLWLCLKSVAKIYLPKLVASENTWQRRFFCLKKKLQIAMSQTNFLREIKWRAKIELKLMRIP